MDVDLVTDLLESQRGAIAKVCSRHGVRRLDVFGSALRDDFRPGPFSFPPSDELPLGVECRSQNASQKD